MLQGLSFYLEKDKCGDIMKLLVCTSEYPPEYSSGIGNVAYNVVDQLRKKGIECTVCSPDGDVKIGSSLMIAKYGRLGVYYFWHKVHKNFKTNDYDVVWLHQPLFLEKNPFFNTIITVHTSIWEYYKILKSLNYKFKLKLYYGIVSILEKYSFRRVDSDGVKFTGVSSQVCKELEDIGISKEKISYIPNGVDIQQFKPKNDKKMLRKKFGIPEEDLVILSLGRLTIMKQPHKLIKTFSMVRRGKGNVRLIIAGKGELADKTKEFAEQIKLKSVSFFGYIDEEDKSDLYACSDYYITTTKYEGLPLSVLEAMASGLPCIVSEIPNLKIVEDANCGIVVDFCDEEAAAQKIIDYIKEDNSAHARNARKYAEENLDWSIIADKYWKEFETIKSRIQLC